jgi:hypothetical protein
MSSGILHIGIEDHAHIPPCTLPRTCTRTTHNNAVAFSPSLRYGKRWEEDREPDLRMMHQHVPSARRVVQGPSAAK